MHQVARAPAYAALALVCVAAAAAAAPPFAALKGLLREGRYDIRAETDLSGVPGSPPGLPLQMTAARQCVSASDVVNGGFTRGGKAKEELCKIEGLAVAGDTAAWTMRCDDLHSEVKMTFRADGYTMELRNASIENKGRQRYVTTQKLVARYLGNC